MANIRGIRKAKKIKSDIEKWRDVFVKILNRDNNYSCIFENFVDGYILYLPEQECKFLPEVIYKLRTSGVDIPPDFQINKMTAYPDILNNLIFYIDESLDFWSIVKDYLIDKIIPILFSVISLVISIISVFK